MDNYIHKNKLFIYSVYVYIKIYIYVYIYPYIFIYMSVYTYMKLKALAAQLYPTLCDPMDCNPPLSSVHGISQARILEWVAIPFSRGSS